MRGGAAIRHWARRRELPEGRRHRSSPKTAALEVAASGVRVNCICPGAIATPLVMGERSMEDVEKTFIHFQPLRRSGMPEDIGNAAMWLASDDSRFVTGHAMVVDGGLTAGTIWSQQPEIFRTHAGMMLRPDPA